VGKRRNRVAKCREREKKSIIVIGIMCKCKVLNYRTPTGISFDGKHTKRGLQIVDTTSDQQRYLHMNLEIRDSRHNLLH
jgi:hypothetical protein